jgi:hypothetical protein
MGAPLMGLGIESTAFLEHMKESGVNFERTAMIGRQNIHTGGYAEDYLRGLGAKEVTSFDICDYEGAEHLHDFNRTIPLEFCNRYTVVLDGGTLEHVFNYPGALANCMNMVKIGGHLLTLTPTNNYSGHGFYQLSPDVFRQFFTNESGFSLKRLLVCQSGTTDWCESSERSANGTGAEMLLLVAAQKFAHRSGFWRVVQGAYEEMWKGHKTA